MKFPVPYWTPSAAFGFASCHVAWGAFGVLVVSLRWGWPVALIALTVWVLLKEFCFDLIVERDTVADSMVDAAFYGAGGALGLLAHWWVTR